MAEALRGLDGPAYVLDASALIAFLGGEPGAGTIAALLRRAGGGDVDLRLSTVNAGEVLLVQERLAGAQASHRTLDLLQALPIEIMSVDLELAARAAWFKLRGGISYADCFAAALAHRDAIPVITTDREFERIADRVRVAWLPRR